MTQSDIYKTWTKTPKALEFGAAADPAGIVIDDKNCIFHSFLFLSVGKEIKGHNQ
jgi:hypothetical protein